ncbi:Rieske 2Fe-2S domain-containing protein [Pigmentiphaga daeguensis]|uniref:Rieske 2Fe-2S domain-containing protein n=1 Tax=Pigmentiphaga daeguensis TaxID=414049 RepID=A0ABN1CAR5_9BURK
MATMSREEFNRLLTQTGPGTPMGALFRRYWLPALLASELPVPDCPPVRVGLLSEKLLAFRDSDGQLGLVDEFCAHRGVSLWFGRNEMRGIRCPYHGWKYDVTGRCVEVPSEPPERGFHEKVRLKSYPLVERGGILWAYMGPPESRPDLPEFEFATVGDDQRYVSKRFQFCNYLQAMEGGIDPHHVAFLHGGEVSKEAMIAVEHASSYFHPELEVKLEARESAGGLVIAYGRDVDGGQASYWRVMHWIAPCFTLIPPFGEHPVHGHFWVPVDDEHCFAWTFDYHPRRSLTEDELDAARQGRGLHAKLIPGTFLPVANRGNDYLMDRAKQAAGIHYSGIESIAMQDASLQESMGPIQDRARETLASSDRIIVMARRALRDAALSLQEGSTPPGADPRSHRVRSATVKLPPDANVLDAVEAFIKVREDMGYASV